MNRILNLLLLVLFLFALLMSCELTSPIGDGSGGGDGDSDGDGDGDGDEDDDDFDDDMFDDDDDDDDNNDDQDTSIIDTEICDEWDVEIVHKQARLLILQDVSGSMEMDDEGNVIPPPNKWSMAKEAISAMLDEFQDDVEFAADTFPNPGVDAFDNCNVSDPVMTDALPDNGDTINSAFEAITPDGSTPLYLAMKNFLTPDYAPLFTDDTYESYLLVVSDGQDTCGTQDGGGGFVMPEDLTEVTTQLLNEQGIMSFVIGFGSGADPDQLNAIAAAGGTEFTEFIPADDQQSLEEALETLIISIVACVYQMEEPDGYMVDPDKVNLYFNDDDTPIPYDEDCAAGEGWQWVDFDQFIFEFCEDACEDLQEGVEKIRAEFGCDQVVVN